VEALIGKRPFEEKKSIAGEALPEVTTQEAATPVTTTPDTNNSPEAN
jgi:hypothetical protein